MVYFVLLSLEIVVFFLCCVLCSVGWLVSWSWFCGLVGGCFAVLSACGTFPFRESVPQPLSRVELRCFVSLQGKSEVFLCWLIFSSEPLVLYGSGDF